MVRATLPLLLPVLLAARASAYYWVPLPEERAPGGAQHPLGLHTAADPMPRAPRRVTPFAPPRMQDAVDPVLKSLSAEQLEEDLRALTSFHTRRTSVVLNVLRGPLTCSADAQIEVRLHEGARDAGYES
jgi:hypothetical protein